MEDVKFVVLKDDQKIVLNDEENDILLSIISDGETKYTFSVPWPSAGYGGGELFLSLSEQYLIFSYYSGQGDEAFMLFKIDNCSLELIYESGNLYGEGASYCFSNDEKFLLQTLRTGWWYDESEAETDKDGNHFYEFGTIRVLDINKRTLNEHMIHVYPSSNWEEGITDNGPFEISKMVNDNMVNITMPWGEETFTFPLEKIILLKMK